MKAHVHLALLALALMLPGGLFGQSLDGPNHIFSDDLLEHLAGKWSLTGDIAGRKATHSVEAEWVLNHQFLRIHEKDTAAGVPGEHVAYEAIVFVGRDNMSERYVAHWLDVFGGRWSETLGYGTRSGDAIEFVFEYPDGPFHTVFLWQPQKNAWEWEMRSRGTNGEWKQFGRMTLRGEQPR